MKNKNTRRGFTLIELLVVVLIIGILAAVAVPQYKKAVLKSRLTKFLPILKNITDAQETYYLANGTYTKELSDLDIEIPTFIPVDLNYNGTMFHYDDDMFLLDMNADSGHIALNYCPASNDAWNTCAPKRDFQIIYVFQHSTQTENANKQLCKVFYNSKIGQEICASFGNFESAS